MLKLTAAAHTVMGTGGITTPRTRLDDHSDASTCPLPMLFDVLDLNLVTGRGSRDENDPAILPSAQPVATRRDGADPNQIFRHSC